MTKNYIKRIVFIQSILAIFILVCALFQLTIIKNKVVAEKTSNDSGYIVSEIRNMLSSVDEESHMELYNEDGTMQHIASQVDIEQYTNTYMNINVDFSFEPPTIFKK